MTTSQAGSELDDILRRRTRVVCVWVTQADGWKLASIQFSSLA